MRLLLDNNLSPRLVDVLLAAGWDVVHVASLELRSAPDRIVLEAARRDGRHLVSADTDFGALLASSHATGPSVVLVRRVIGRRVNDLADILIANLPRSRTTSNKHAASSSATTHSESDNCPSDDRKLHHDRGSSPVRRSIGCPSSRPGLSLRDGRGQSDSTPPASPDRYTEPCDQPASSAR